MIHTYLAIAWEKVTDPIKKSFSDMYTDIADMIPNIIVAVVILVFGFIVVGFCRKVLNTTLTKMNFNGILDKIGVGGVLKKIGVKGTATELVTTVLFWVLMLFIVKNAAKALNIADIEILITNIITYLPKIVIAVIILLFGFIVAEIVQNVTRDRLEALNLDYAKPLSNILFGFVFVVILTVALDQLEIQTELLNATVKIILIGLAVAAALALGLGLKGLTKAIVAGVYARDIYKVGTQIEIDGELARVAGVGPVTTKLQTNDGGFIMIPNAELVELRVKGQSAEE